MDVARRTGVPGILILWLAVTAAAGRVGPAAGAGPSPSAITLDLKDATAAESAAALTQALAVPVFTAAVEGGPVRATVHLEAVTPVEALDRIAAAFHGRWQPVYQVRPAGGAGGHPVPFATGRRVTLRVVNADPQTVLSTVARADGGVLSEPSANRSRVTLDLADVPVEVGMDRVAAALGLAWTRAFQIIPATAPAAPAVPVGGTPSNGAPSALSAPSPPRPQMLYPLADPGTVTEPPPGQFPSGKRSDLARALADGLTRVMQMDPNRRGSAIRQFAQEVERGLRDLSTLPPADQARHRAQVSRAYRSGMRVYQGLTPDQQQEFRPLFDVLRRWLHL